MRAQAQRLRASRRTGSTSTPATSRLRIAASTILANVAELKAAAKGNANILRAGLELLKLMAGSKIPDGTIRSIVSLTMKQSVGKLKALNARTSGINLHKAVMQVLKNVDKAMESSGAEFAPGGDTVVRSRLRKFCLDVQLARCTDAEARRIAGLFGSEKGSVLARIYGNLSDGDFPGVAQNMVEHMRRAGLVFSDGVEKLYAAVQERNGVPKEDRHVFPPLQNPDYALIDRNDVATDIFTYAGEAADREKNAFLDKVVVGRGPNATRVRELYSGILGERPFQPGAMIQGRTGDNVLGMFNRNFCKARKYIDPDGIKAESLALDGEGRDAKLEFGGNFTKRQFSLSFDNNNSVLVIRCDTERALDSLRVKNGGAFENVQVGAGSKVEASYEVRISADEVDRFAAMQPQRLNRYDDRHAENFVNNPGENPHAHSKMGNVLGDFKIGGERLRCSTSFKLTVN